MLNYLISFIQGLIILQTSDKSITFKVKMHERYKERAQSLRNPYQRSRATNDEFIKQALDSNRWIIDQDNGFILSRKTRKAIGFKHEGYLKVGIRVNGIVKQIRVHRIIYINSYGLPGTDKVINHKDGNKMNNKPENLEAVSFLKNFLHAEKAGLQSRDLNGRFVSSPNNEDSDEDDLNNTYL